jgi:hypothetical protein
MKNLKLSLLALVSVISFGSLSQSFVSTSNTTSAGTCDGTALFDTTILNINILTWNNQGVAIQYGGYSIDSLCSGTYSVTYIDTTNSIATTIFTIGTSCVNFYAAIIPIDSTLYNGSMTVYTVNGTAPYTYQWDNGVMLQTINNLSAGVYCCYVMDANGCTDSLCDIIGTQSTNFGDTLVLNSIGTCNSPASTFTTTIEDCTINFNTIDTAYMTIDSFINSGLDSILCVWYVIDTTGTYQTYMVNYPMIDSTGCYDFQLTVYCYNKTSGYKTIIINQNEYIGFAGAEELAQSEKTIVKVTDMLGRSSEIKDGVVLLIHYSDGTIKKVFTINL